MGRTRATLTWRRLRSWRWWARRCGRPGARGAVRPAARARPGSLLRTAFDDVLVERGEVVDHHPLHPVVHDEEVRLHGAVLAGVLVHFGHRRIVGRRLATQGPPGLFGENLERLPVDLEQIVDGRSLPDPLAGAEFSLRQSLVDSVHVEADRGDLEIPGLADRDARDARLRYRHDRRVVLPQVGGDAGAGELLQQVGERLADVDDRRDSDMHLALLRLTGPGVAPGWPIGRGGRQDRKEQEKNRDDPGTVASHWALPWKRAPRLVSPRRRRPFERAIIARTHPGAGPGTAAEPESTECSSTL